MNDLTVDTNSKELPLVSICCTCYNQEKYIRETLDGFLMQKTNFPYEIIIFDDASTDSTQDIILEYKSRYPDIFRLFLQKENLWQIKGISGTETISFPNARGKYIAMCEGDDYWIDPYKLQKEVDFLESHPDYGLVHTRHQVYIQEEDRFEDLIQEKHTGDIFHQLLFDNEIATLTSLMRTELVHAAIRDHFYVKGFVALDYPLWLYISHFSKVHFLEDVTAVYRKLPESASNSKDPVKGYKFIVGIVDIQIHFAEKFGCLDLILENVSTKKKRNLKFAYLFGNKEISVQAYQFLKKHNKLGLKDKLFYYSTVYPTVRFLARRIAGLKNRN